MSATDEVKAKLDIVEVVSPYVSLQKSGRTFKANCPFHTERTPSFVLNQERQSWHCFGACATGGDIFSFVMRAENLQFGDALRMLARRAGVELRSSGDRAQSNAIHSVNSAAAGFYQDVMASETGAIARSYLDERGVESQARERFKLGLSPPQWDGLVRYLSAHGLKEQDAIRAGLIRQNDSGQAYDFFRNRLMFPIFDRDGNIVGFGARALDDSNPKYINTARTEAFDKRNTLYALNFAASEIRRSGTAVIVEGYMDAIAAHEHGYRNVVASMGTALTEAQVSQLRSMAQDFVLALDPDAAGQEATLRSLESSWNVFRSMITRRGRTSDSILSQWTPPSLKIASLPAGLDPDALIRSDPKRWEVTVGEALPLLDFVIPAIVSRTDLNMPGSRAGIARGLAGLINRLDEMDQYEYWTKLADALNVPLDSLRASINIGSGGGRDRRRRAQAVSVGADVEVSPNLLQSRVEDTVEEYILRLLIRVPDMRGAVEDMSPNCFRRIENRVLFTALLSCPTISEFRDGLEPEVAEQLERLEAVHDTVIADIGRREAEAAVAECRTRLELRLHVDLQTAVTDGMLDDSPPPRENEQRVSEANQQIWELHTTGVGHN